eukprot:7601153-Pyramimonas_sp.AAC.1
MGPRSGWDAIGHPGGLTASDQLALWEMESVISAGRDAEYVVGEASRGWPKFLFFLFGNGTKVLTC